MPEKEVATTEASEETQVATDEAVSLIDSEGKFSEGWKDSLPEEIRGEKCLDTFGDLSGAMKMLVHAQKSIGKDKIVMPTEKSTQAEWDSFYEIMGRPKTPEEYVWEPGEGIAEYVDPNLTAEARTLFHELGFSSKQAEALFAFEEKRITGALEQQEVVAAQAMKESEEALRAKWGGAYDQRLHLANKMVAENTTEETKQPILDTIGNNPVVADFLATIAKKFVEGGIITGTEADMPTPVEATAKADELRATPGYLDGQLKKTNPAKHRQITQDISALYEQAHPEQQGNR